MVTLCVIRLWPSGGVGSGRSPCQLGGTDWLLIDALMASWLVALVVYCGLRAERQLRQSRGINQQLQAEIEQRRQVEMRLRLSEERWQLVVQGNHDGIVDWNVNTNEVLFSEHWKTMLGFTPEQISGQFTEWSDRVHPADWPRVNQALQDYFDRKISFYQIEYRLRCQDGTDKWILDRGQALWDETGQATRLVSSQTDITARKQTELALQTSEARYRELLAHLNTGIVVHAPDTRIIGWNQTACEVLGLTREQLFGKTANDPIWQLVRDDGTVMPLAEYPVNHVLATQRPIHNRIVGVQHHHQARRWVLMTAFPEFDGDHQLTQVVVTFIDITRLKQAEADLRSLTAVMEHAVSGIAQIDAEGDYRYVNQAYATLKGYLPGQLWGVDWTQTVHPDDVARCQQAYQEMIQTGKVELEARSRWPDDSTFYHQVVMVATYSEQQQFTGHYCFLKDISDRKQTELALEQELIRQRALFETSIDGIVILNLRGEVVQTSDSFAAMLGYTVAETMQLNVTDWDVQWTAAELRQVLAGDVVLPPVFETRHRRRDGTVYAVEISYSRVVLEGETVHFCICRDISDRKQAEALLVQSEEKFRLAIDLTYNWEYWQAPDGSFIYVSPSCERITGYTPTEFIAQPDLLPQIVHPDDYDRLMQHDCAEVQTDDAIEFRITHRQGEQRWISHVCQPVFDATGVYLGRRASNRDVTERVQLTQEREQAIAALRQSEVTKQAIIDAIPDLLIRMRADGTYVDFISNNRFNLVKPEHIRQGASVFDILPPELAQLRWHSAQQALASGQLQTYEHEIIIDGQRCYEEIRMVPLFQDELLVMVRNISDRKRAESDLRHQKEMFQAIVTHIPVMITVFNQQGQFELINPAVERILGWSFAAWQQPEMLARCYPNAGDRAQVVALMQAATGEWREMPTMTATGHLIETSWANVRLSNGYCVGIGQDVSDRKQKEAAVLQAMAAAEAANRAKSLFLANMSHELRTPLNVILGFAEVMTHDPALTPTQLQDLQTIHRSGDHLLRLINDILDLSKIEAGHTAINLTGFDLIALLHALRTMMTEQAKAKGLQLVFEIAATVPQFVLADEHRLRQILLNLLGNAIKFTPAGQITVRVTAAPDAQAPVLAGTGRSQPVQLQVEVIDTGIGIAPADQARIFDAFIQVGAAHQTATGTGLGLSICRKLLELMQGELTVQSVPQQGSTFRFTLPVQAVSGTQSSLEPPDRVILGLMPGQSTRRILVVDDEPTNRQLLVRLMTRLGLEVREATNGHEAIQIWQEWQPHLTWMDIRMPQLDGYEATKRIRALAPTSTQAIIALTAQASRSDRALSLAAGCNDYVSKPCREQTVLLKLQEHLNLELLYEAAAAVTPAAAEPEAAIDWLAFTDPASPLRVAAAWVEALENAAVCCHDQAIAALLDQLSPEFAPLQEYIAALSFQFQFERILALTQQLKQSASPRPDA